MHVLLEFNLDFFFDNHWVKKISSDLQLFRHKHLCKYIQLADRFQTADSTSLTLRVFRNLAPASKTYCCAPTY